VLLVNPLTQQREEVLKRQIESRAVSKLSQMPEGLLNVLSKDEILDLVAYLESDGKPDAECPPGGSNARPVPGNELRVLNSERFSKVISAAMTQPRSVGRRTGTTCSAPERRGMIRSAAAHLRNHFRESLLHRRRRLLIPLQEGGVREASGTIAPYLMA
jgi:hypothetical protein